MWGKSWFQRKKEEINRKTPRTAPTKAIQLRSWQALGHVSKYELVPIGLDFLASSIAFRVAMEIEQNLDKFDEVSM